MLNQNRLAKSAAGVLVWATWAVAGPTVRGVVPAALSEGQAVAVPVPIPGNLERAPEGVLTGRVSIDGQPAGEVLLQTEPADKAADTPARAWFTWTAKPGQAGKPITLELAVSAARKDRPVCRLRYSNPRVEARGPNDNLILAYRHGPADPAMKAAMTSYIHPLVGLDDEILTDCSPSDHPHHRGVFWSWVRIMQNGRVVGETWMPRDITLLPADLVTAEGPVMGRFAARHYWLHDPGSPNRPATQAESSQPESVRLFQEDLTCRIFELNQGRAVDLDLTLTALQDGLEIGGQTQLNKGYGGLSIRFSTVQEGKATQPQVVADSKAITEPTVNHLKALWVDWTGVFNGPDGRPLPHRSGGSLFVHPSHPPLPGSAPEWITRFYGPINVAYPGLEMLAVPRDKPMRLKYRIWIHRGDAAEGAVDAQYRAYAADWKWKLAE